MNFLFLLVALSNPPASTPGTVADLSVTQANIKTTICRADYTKTVRPSAHWTDALKAMQMATLKLKGDPSSYEEDHRVPLEVGGAPMNPANLWPEIWPEARKKDRLETAVKRDVCSGRLTLKQGQAIFLGDFWKEYEKRFGKP